MTKKMLSRRIPAVLLSALMVVGSLPMRVLAAGDDSGAKPAITWEKVENTQEPGKTHLRNPAELPAEKPLYQDSDIVRVSVVLKDKSTLEKGFSAVDIAENRQAMKYRAELRSEQDDVADAISETVLDGEELDVVWNLTLAANIISQ